MAKRGVGVYGELIRTRACLCDVRTLTVVHAALSLTVPALTGVATRE